MGGFLTTVSRLCRANIRPIFVSAPPAPPSLLSRAYDIAGTITTILTVNFISAPFMLLTIHDSFEAWRVLRWYGFWIIFGGLAFFYAGGATLLQSFHPKPEKRARPHLHGEMPHMGPLTESSKESLLTPAFVPPINSVAREVENKLREFN